MFIIEGNIGVGKTTLLKAIKKYFPELNIVFEPVNQWNNSISGKSLLSDFYSNPKRWAYTLETYAMACRVKEYLKESKNKKQKTLMERSIFSGHYCFAKNDFLNGYMTPMEWEIYQNWFSFLISNKAPLPTGFIYLKTDPEIALDRIKKRNRNGESKISIDYLKQIDERHNEFLIEKKDLTNKLTNLPILTLDCNSDFEKEINSLTKNLDKISEFLKTSEVTPESPI